MFKDCTHLFVGLSSGNDRDPVEEEVGHTMDATPGCVLFVIAYFFAKVITGKDRGDLIFIKACFHSQTRQYLVVS